VSLAADGHIGRGECVPYARYGETVPGVLDALERCRPEVERGLTPCQIPGLALPGAAANALDCALWDLEAKIKGQPAWRLLGLPPPQPVCTAYTLSLGSPAAMAAQARREAGRPLLKLKLGGPGDAERLRAVRNAAPRARLIVDANEGWDSDTVRHLLELSGELGVEMVEQPLPAAADEVLRSLPRKVALCADESAHGRASLGTLRGKYEVVNIKLDKTGGLTEALAVKQAANALGFEVMVGCMLATSLGMAPAVLVAQGAKYVDLDAPLLLARDRAPGIHFEQSLLHPASPALWG
jgi:L-alanine-DL-glutamate epimerase-like enolase superfamily enzyme